MSGPERRRPLALTLGEPAGIGPDIAITAWLARERESIPPFILVGDSGMLDPEVYEGIAQNHPGRILTVYIRDVSGERRDREVREIGDSLAA